MVRQLIAAVLMAVLLTNVTGCGQTKVIRGVEYDTYGLLNEDDVKNPDIAYAPIWGNVVWGIILVETIVAPIYFFGFSLFEPVGKKPVVKGAIPQTE